MAVENIKIIEGGVPYFSPIEERHPFNGVFEGPDLLDVGVTRVKAVNGNEVVERCNRAWRNGETICLEYIPSITRIKEEVPIVAARTFTSEDDQEILELWVIPTPDALKGIYDEDEEDDEENPYSFS